ncbi:hypothetical protein COJ60_26340 [Bacillus cereus]|nr:hypothetical protein COJ60_26340 [Bacillus cereus]
MIEYIFRVICNNLLKNNSILCIDKKLSRSLGNFTGVFYLAKNSIYHYTMKALPKIKKKYSIHSQYIPISKPNLSKNNI